MFGFGNTEESYRIMIYGTAARGLPTDGAQLLWRPGRIMGKFASARPGAVRAPTGG